MNEDDNKVVTMKVRVTPEFREKLVTTAKENNRSMNAEIVDRLEKSFESNNGFSIDDPLVRAHFIAMQDIKYDEKIMALKYTIRVIGDSDAELTKQLSQLIKYTQLEKDDLGFDITRLLENSPTILQDIKDRDFKSRLTNLIFSFKNDVEKLSPKELIAKYPGIELD
ncbi:Arc family DNA-binding protein [Acinetobacter oleivorans]|uniref:Arc family DNA-binding protein n=1 Tax=Acinetobacter oleivorans TaxID=1148157 RepID=UPI0019008B18|nr:Arc family DNA-binding protein [Acinetobacter oleivorans]MBJ9739719.1 Arc family DNA-binding protein [Acinetobacter oleivorans]MCU4409719.1 Arc family DNA-binding protein [Acinetobacter oleivorans]